MTYCEILVGLFNKTVIASISFKKWFPMSVWCFAKYFWARFNFCGFLFWSWLIKAFVIVQIVIECNSSNECFPWLAINGLGLTLALQSSRRISILSLTSTFTHRPVSDRSSEVGTSADPPKFLRVNHVTCPFPLTHHRASVYLFISRLKAWIFSCSQAMTHRWITLTTVT